MPQSLLDFDPYEVWLGIKTRQRPLNPYELLNLAPLDGDPTRIRLAIERQRLLLSKHSAGVDPDVWRMVHDEVEAAAAALIDPEKRAVVNAAIKRKMAHAGGNGCPAGHQATKSSAAAAGTLRCPNCQRENPNTSRFCGGCGKGLWEKCPQCGGELATDERFCGQCGTDVRAVVEEQSKQVQQRLDAARVFVEEHRYDAALSALCSVAAIDDPKLAPWAERALGQIEEVESLRRQRLAEADAAKAQAAKCIREQAWNWAAKVLEAIPPPLRDEEANSLLEQALFASKEMATLVAEIREAAQQNRTWELFPKIERALSLRPDYQPVLDLAAKLRDRFVAAARRRLAEHGYDDAAQMLRQVPASLRNDEVVALLDQVSELGALLSDLKQSPHATPQTLALAERLVKMAPQDAEAAKLCQELKKQVAARPADRRLAVAPWAAPAKRPAGGLPVDWLGNIGRAEPAGETVAQTLREHPGEFFVSLGLALQGLDEAAIDINLLPPEKGNVLLKLATMPLVRRGPTSAWGIDLGSYALKAMKLAKDSAGKIKIEACEYVLLKKPLSHPDAEARRLGILGEALADLAAVADFKGSRVVAALPGQRVLGRFFELPPLAAKKVPAAVEYEARHQLPIDLSELCWGWSALGTSAKPSADEAPRRMMVVAARQAHVEERLSLFKGAAIRVDVVQSECLALHSALKFEQSGQASQDAVALVDVGADESNFVVSAPHSVWFRSFGQGGDSFTAALSKQLQLTCDEAEVIKRNPAKARRYHQFREALAPLFVQFASEIDRSLASYARSGVTPEVKRLYGVGGGFHLHGLLRHLRPK